VPGEFQHVTGEALRVPVLARSERNLGLADHPAPLALQARDQKSEGPGTAAPMNVADDPERMVQ
jgi:hypothetical protein